MFSSLIWRVPFDFSHRYRDGLRQQQEKIPFKSSGNGHQSICLPIPHQALPSKHQPNLYLIRLLPRCPEILRTRFLLSVVFISRNYILTIHKLIMPWQYSSSTATKMSSYLEYNIIRMGDLYSVIGLVIRYYDSFAKVKMTAALWY